MFHTLGAFTHVLLLEQEGLRLLTGQKLKDDWIPAALRSQLKPFCAQMDSLLIGVCKSICMGLFGGKSAERLAEEYDLPLLLNPKKQVCVMRGKEQGEERSGPG